MSEALNAEKILASIIVELRENIVESRKDTAKIRDSVLELRGSISELIGDVLELRSNITEHGRRIDNILEEVADTRADLFHASTKIEDTNKDLNVVKDKLDDNNRKLDENNHRLGKLTNKVGEIVEKIVLPGIVDKFNEKGFKFDAVSTNVEFLNEKKSGNLTEVDALLENGKFVIAVETKMDLSVSDVNAHIKRLQALRKVPRFKGKKIYGAVSTAIAREKPVNYALSKGFYVLQQPDVMAVRIIDFPKGHSAKAW